MSIYPKLAITTTVSLLSLTAIKFPAQAATFFEIGDAGDSFNSVQLVNGLSGQALDRIEGRLESTDDKDYFRFFFGGVGVLKIETGPYFNTSFPSNTFPAFQIFNASNSLVGGYFQGNFTYGQGNIKGRMLLGEISFMPGSAEFHFDDLSAGEYVLKVDGTGQANEPKPVYEGDYAISLSGAEFIPSQSVPEPGTLMGTVVAGGISWLIKKKKASSKRHKLNPIPTSAISQDKCPRYQNGSS